MKITEAFRNTGWVKNRTIGHGLTRIGTDKASLLATPSQVGHSLLADADLKTF